MKGFVMDCAEDCSVSQTGNALRQFSLMDRKGAYISCIAFWEHIEGDVFVQWRSRRKVLGRCTNYLQAQFGWIPAEAPVVNFYGMMQAER